MKAPANDTFAGFRSLRAADEEYAAFDALPQPLRRRLMETVTDWCSNSWLDEFLDLSREMGPARATRYCLEALRHEEAKELHDFAAVNGNYSAHLAAGASIQRYGAN